MTHELADEFAFVHREANSVLGAAGVYVLLGRVRGKHLLGVKYLLPSTKGQSAD